MEVEDFDQTDLDYFRCASLQISSVRVSSCPPFLLKKAIGHICSGNVKIEKEKCVLEDGGKTEESETNLGGMM